MSGAREQGQGDTRRRRRRHERLSPPARRVLVRAPALALAALLLGALSGGALPHADAAGARVDEVCRTLTDDANYKVRVQAALVLGKLADPAAVACLVKGLGDSNKTVRAMAAQALGQIGSPAALEPLRSLAKRDPDPFVRAQTEKALALVGGAASGAGAGTVAAGAKRGAKMYLNFGPFTGGTKNASADSVKIVRDTLASELGKLPTVTLAVATPPPPMAFLIDGNVTRLDDASAGAATEVSCGVKVMVARWPSKSIISWTSAEASVQSGSRPRDKENARRECLEATAGQLAEDLAKFLKAQGG